MRPDLAGADGGDPVTAPNRFDVVAQNINTGAKRLIDMNRTERDAEAIMWMAVMRRRVDEECFYKVTAGSVKP